jgi:hypothetical protein
MRRMRAAAGYFLLEALIAVAVLAITGVSVAVVVADDTGETDEARRTVAETTAVYDALVNCPQAVTASTPMNLLLGLKLISAEIPLSRYSLREEQAPGAAAGPQTNRLLYLVVDMADMSTVEFEYARTMLANRYTVRQNPNSLWILVVRDDSLSSPTLIAPAADAAEVSPQVLFQWMPVPHALEYVIQIADEPTFAGPVARTVTGCEATVARPTLTTSYWRVLARNATDTSAWSETRKFTTRAVVRVSGLAIWATVSHAGGNRRNLHVMYTYNGGSSDIVGVYFDVLGGGYASTSLTPNSMVQISGYKRNWMRPLVTLTYADGTTESTNRWIQL